jgi:hypothetical protein
MNAIIRLRLVFVALFPAVLFCTVNGASAQGTRSRDPQVCSAAEPQELTEDMRWRLRAYNNLDCLMGKLEQAMNRPAGTNKNQVRLSREEVEQLLNLAWWAKDAAQRISR